MYNSFSLVRLSSVQEKRRRVTFILQRTCIILAELEQIELNELYETRTWNKALLHKHKKNAIIAQSYYKLEASTIASSRLELTNA